MKHVIGLQNTSRIQHAFTFGQKYTLPFLLISKPWMPKVFLLRQVHFANDACFVLTCTHSLLYLDTSEQRSRKRQLSRLIELRQVKMLLGTFGFWSNLYHT